MNLLLFEQSELRDTLLPLNDRRAHHILDVLGLEKGDTLRVGMLNGKMGTGEVVHIEGRCVDLEVRLTDVPPDTHHIELILALPRPIMLQRILKQATVLGVRHFHLIRSRRVQKSFFQSNLLQAEKLKDILMQGLEQAMDTRMPEVSVHKRFKPFVEDVVDTLNPSSRLLAHPGETRSLPDLYREDHMGNGIVLAVGPEGGWSDYETGCFQKKGFQCFSMGSRILHVDTAVIVLLSQLLLLQELSATQKSVPLRDQSPR